jgi:hypothetical protein
VRFHGEEPSPPSPEREVSPSKDARTKVRNALRLIPGGGERVQESLESRDAVARVLVEAGADLLLRRISCDRAEEIERQVDRILSLFDRVDQSPELFPVLQKRLDDLEGLMRETRSTRGRRAAKVPARGV